MPGYIVRQKAATKDGSALGGGKMATVRATSVSEARQQGADLLGISIHQVEAEPITHDPWSDFS